MYTDWLLIRRLSWELARHFRGARVRDAGLLEDGRFALALWRRGTQDLLCIDVYAATPLVTVEDGDLPIAVEPGFVRAAGAALRGSTLIGVRSRTGDRVLRLDFGTRSRFGVENGYALICELVPRFGNIVLVKDGTVVAAAKSFSAAQNSKRSVEPGDMYEPPPLRPGKSSPLLSQEGIDAIAASPVSEDDLYVYRDVAGRLVQAHVVPLEIPGALVERAPSLLSIFEEMRHGFTAANRNEREGKRRRALERTLGERERKACAELEQTRSRLERSARREELRERGAAIYATLHELPHAEREAAKDLAVSLFAEYRKAGSAVEHLERRLGELERLAADVEALQWELERAGDADLDDVERAIAQIAPHGNPGRQRAPYRKRKALQYQTSSGSRISVGRTPMENADLTFRVAGPDDLWFHVQNQPGAHVILQRSDPSPVPDDDIAAAAALAALHSKAKNSPKVSVDYTQRKHVRKRPSAAPGLVFYTHAKTIYVEPSAPGTP